MSSLLAKLLVIDPQNDFCDIPQNELPVIGHRSIGGLQIEVTERPALPVAGAHFDMLRLADFVKAAGERLNRIVVTLDSHPFVAIERTTFWQDAQGQEVQPFTQITASSVRQGAFSPVNSDRSEPISGKPLRAAVIDLLDRLEAAGRFTLMAWPVHCVTATWGANIHRALAEELAQWERSSSFPVRKVLKGEYPLAEHYGAFEAETPLFEVPSTRFNGDLADELRCDVLFVGGEASSHCVATSVEQLIRYRKTGEGIVLLTDCMSPVAGFEQDAKAACEQAVQAGAKLMTSSEAIAFLRRA